MDKDLHTVVDELFDKIERLQAENEELKNKSDYWKDKYADVHIRLTNQVSELKNDLETLDKYRKALEDIREYCEEQNLKADYTACDILSKINEVIGVEE